MTRKRKMFSRALLRCSVDDEIGPKSLSVEEHKGEYYIAMYYKPIAEAFLQLSEDGQSDFFHHVYEKLHEYETKPEPGMIAMSYEKSIEQLANSLYPEARAFIIDLFMALPLEDKEVPDFSMFGKELQQRAEHTWLSGSRLRKKMEEKKDG